MINQSGALTQYSQNINNLLAGKQDNGRDENRFDLTGLVGGASTDLDYLVTVDDTYAVGGVVSVIISGIYQKWQLISGTNATSIQNGYVRPTDYATTSNEKVWQQVL